MIDHVLCYIMSYSIRFILFFVTMRRQIAHMIKYKYLPFTFGKKVRPCSLLQIIS